MLNFAAENKIIRFIHLNTITDMKRKEIISAIKKNVAKCNGMCFTENLWINNGGNFEVDYVGTDRVVFADGEYCTFDEFSDENLKVLLNAVLAVVTDYSDTTTQDLFAMVCKECDVETVLDNAEAYVSEDNLREFLMACLGESVK